MKTDCFSDGTLRAWLDGLSFDEEATAIRSHVSACSTCRTRLESLEATKLGTYTALAQLHQPVSTATALKQLRAAQAVETPVLTLSNRTTGITRSTSMSSKWKSWLAGVTAVLAIAGLLALPPVQTAAAQSIPRAECGLCPDQRRAYVAT
jgi:anti-sigma factor RsiW